MKLEEKISYRRLMKCIFSKSKPITRKGILRLYDQPERSKREDLLWNATNVERKLQK